MRSKNSSFPEKKRPDILGHRGCRGNKNPVENTIPAIEEAIRQGADGVEFDVRLTADNVAVVFHDRTLERLTNGKGRVRKTSFADLRKLHVYDKEQKRPSGNDPVIPTLEEVLDAIEPHLSEYCLEHGKAFKVNIEIKGKEAPEEIAQEIARRLQGGKWSEQNFHISGFKIDRLEVASKRLTELLKQPHDVEIGALYVQNLGDRVSRGQVFGLLGRVFKEMQRIGAKTINLPIEYYSDPKIAKKIRENHFEPVAWTYKEKPPETSNVREVDEQIRRIIEDNITIITDYPAEMRAALREGTRILDRERSAKNWDR